MLDQWQSTGDPGFDFESVDPAEVDQVLKALVGQKTHFVTPYQGKVLCFDEEPGRRSVEP